MTNGITTVNVDPSPGFEVTSIVPLRRLTMRWTMAKPNPVDIFDD